MTMQMVGKQKKKERKMNKEKLTKLEKQWILYDVGNSAFAMLGTTIIPIYYKNMAINAGISMADSTAYLSYAISLSTILVAILGPILGAMADNKGRKKPFFSLFMLVGVLATAALAIPFGWFAFLGIYLLAKVGFSGSLIFYDSMLVDVTTDERMDDVSSQGYAWGYIGSCVPFVLSLLLVLKADLFGLSSSVAMAIAFLLNAIWWVGVTIPLLKNYKQLHYIENNENAIKESFKRLLGIFGEIKNNKKIFFFLLAFFCYIDGVYTIIDMATSYGKDVGLDDTSMLLALLLTQVVAFPCSFIIGKLASKFEADKLIMVCIIAYSCIALFALQLDKAWEFWLLATCVGMFQGSIQALSRSYYAKIIPKEKSSEYFGLYDIFGKGASFIGTLLMGVTSQIFNTSKAGVVGLTIMFLIGLVLFSIQMKQE